MPQQSVLLIGIDDTDRKDTPGTGRLARQMLDELVKTGCQPIGITRHQLLVHPDVPYTSHNSAACLAVTGSVDIKRLQEMCLSFLRSNSAEGSHPALCVAWKNEVPDELVSFGLSAQQRVLVTNEAVSLAEQTGIWLKALTDPPDGAIGALGAVGLRAGGNDGRFINLGQIREAQDTMSVKEIKALGVDAVVDRQGRPLDKNGTINTLDWIRPRLEDHLAILYVEQTKDGSDVWVPADRSKSRRLGNTWQKSVADSE